VGGEGTWVGGRALEWVGGWREREAHRRVISCEPVVRDTSLCVEVRTRVTVIKVRPFARVDDVGEPLALQHIHVQCCLWCVMRVVGINDAGVTHAAQHKI